MAQEKGDSGAEAIAMEIGAYMGEVIACLIWHNILANFNNKKKCIQVIEFYGGDVVKVKASRIS